MRHGIAALGFLFSGLYAMPAYADSPLVVVFPFAVDSVELSAKQISGLRDEIDAILAKSDGHRVIPLAKLKRRLKRRKSPGFDKCTDVDCQRVIASAVRAKLALATDISRSDDRCRVALDLFDIKGPGGRMVVKKGGCESSAITLLVKNAALKLTGQAELAPTKTTTSTVAKTRPKLGASVRNVLEKDRKRLKLADDVRGAVVLKVKPGGAGKLVGLQKDDVIVGMNGTPLKTARGLTKLKPGKLVLEVLRGGKKVSLEVEL